MRIEVTLKQGIPASHLRLAFDGEVHAGEAGRLGLGGFTPEGRDCLLAEVFGVGFRAPIIARGSIITISALGSAWE